MVDKVREELQRKAEAGCLMRLVWMFVGFAVLAVLLMILALGDRGPLSFVSIGFWVVVGLVVLARHADVARYQGTTTDGETPATMADVKRYRTWLIAISGGAWALALVL